MQKDVLFLDEFLDSIFRNIGYKIWKIVSDGILIPGVSEFRLFDKNIREYIVKNKKIRFF